MSHRELYHDTVLSEDVLCQSEWKIVATNGLVKVERDRQMIGAQFDEPFRIDIDGDGGLIDSRGRVIDIEIKLVDSLKNEEFFLFSGARGNRIATYVPSNSLSSNRSFEEVYLRCGAGRKIKKLLWTTYDLKDMP